MVVESPFSVDGDTAPLRDLHAACRAHGAVLVVDEAHGFGVAGLGGRGAVFDAGLAGQPDVVVAATMSKALASQGGAILGSAELIAHLVDAARSMIFDTGLAPASVGAALAALGWSGATRAAGAGADALLGDLRAGARARDWRPPPPSGAVTSIILGAPRPRSPRGLLPGARAARGLFPATVGAGREIPAAGDGPCRFVRPGSRADPFGLE